MTAQSPQDTDIAPGNPPPAPRGSQTVEVQSQPGIGIKPLLSLKRHYRISLLVWIIVIIAGLPGVWIKGRSVYSAEAIFQVSPRYMKNLESDQEVEMQSNSQYREYVNQLSNTVTRYDVLQRALATLRESGINIKPPALTERKYIERLQRVIYVRAILDTYMVKVGTTGSSEEKEHLHDLINAVMNSFLETTRVEQIYGSTERLNMLNDSAAKLGKEVSEMESERVLLAEKLGLTTFTEGASNPYDQILAQTREKLAQADVERSQADAVYRAFMTQKEVPAELGRSLLEMRLSDLGLQTQRTEIIRRIEQLNQTMVGLAEKHPARAPALAEIQVLSQRLKSTEDNFDRTVFENYRVRLLGTLNEKTEVAAELRQSLTQLEAQSADFARIFQRAIRLTKAINDREDRLKQIQDRLNYLDTERNALGFVRLVMPAMPAEMPMGIGKTKLLMALILAAFGAALAVPVGIDMMDRRIRSVTDAEKLMGIPAAGWQIRKEDLPTRIFAEEQTRRFVSTLIRVRNRSQRSVFAFTSVKPAGGTTSIILDTAAGLSRVGSSVLIVEANAFAPFAGFPDSQPGLSDLLAEKAGIEGLPCSYTHGEVDLTVVTIGHSVDEGLQRLDILSQAIKVWSSTYDFILFDLPPALLSADTEMLIEKLGQIFLVVEGEAVTRGEVSRSKRLLQKLDPDAIGLFVNSVPLFRGSGYMEEVIVETLTRGKYSRFMNMADWHLRWELFRTRLSLWWSDHRREKAPTQKDRHHD